MEEIVNNELSHEGVRRMKIISVGEISAARYQARVPNEARARVVCVPGRDDLLDLFSLELTWPVFEPWKIMNYGPKNFLRLLMVNFAYAERVSACVELGAITFFARTHFAPKYAFVRNCPDDKDGADVHGCILLKADWMPNRCVAIGGRDG